LSLPTFFVRKQFSALGAILGVRRRLSEKKHFFLRKNSTPKKCHERFFLQKFRQFFLQKNPIHAQIDSFQPCFAPKQRLFFLRKIPPVFLRKITHFLGVIFKNVLSVFSYIPPVFLRKKSDSRSNRQFSGCFAPKQRLLFLRKIPPVFLRKITHFLAPSKLRRLSSDFDAIRAQTSMPAELRLRCHPSSDFGAMTSAPSELRLRRHPSSGFGAIRAQTLVPSELRFRRRLSSDFGAIRAQASVPSELRLRRRPSLDFGAVRA
jgi:hypothetical protein